MTFLDALLTMYVLMQNDHDNVEAMPPRYAYTLCSSLHMISGRLDPNI